MIRDQDIPIIDISATQGESDDPYGLAEIGRKVNAACLEHGFFYISGHGVSTVLQMELETLSKTFFAQPIDEKMNVSMEKGGKAWRGYFPVGNELTSGRPDQKEGLYFGRESDPSDEKMKIGVPLHGMNLYPNHPEKLRSVVQGYMATMEQLGHRIMRCIAVGLDLRPNYFQAEITRNPFTLFRIFHYPDRSASENSWGVGEHTDYGLLTILKQDDVGGLMRHRFLTRSSVTIGDMLELMTGERYHSTPHRVLNTSATGRLSFPFFFDPNFDAFVKPISHLNSSGQTDIQVFKEKYGNYLLKKVSKVFPALYSGL